jgi:hypothetical protein
LLACCSSNTQEEDHDHYDEDDEALCTGVLWDLLVGFLCFVCRVGIHLPTLEVRYENLTIDANCFVGDRALPTLKNATLNFVEVKEKKRKTPKTQPQTPN